jgi:pyridoxal 5'-phosphate synthase pdxS subunit
VSIPVMAKVRIGHFVEAQVLQSLGVDYIDESEVLTPADSEFHINKKGFDVPFVCGARNLAEALRRINEGAAMVRTKGEAGTGNIVEAVKHIRAINREIKELGEGNPEEFAKREQVAVGLVRETMKLGRLPVVNFAAGGISTPADAALCMQLGCDGVFVGSGIFKSSNPEKMASGIVEAVAHYKDAARLAEVSEGLGDAMRGLELSSIPPEQRLSERGI